MIDTATNKMPDHPVVDRSAAVLFFLGNVASSVFIVFVNKHLFKMGFHFPTCLSALHFITCAVAMRLVRSPGEKEAALDPLDSSRAPLTLGKKGKCCRHLEVCLRPNPWKINKTNPKPCADHYILIAAGSTSIMSLNLSMFVNTLSFYQVCGDDHTCKKPPPFPLVQLQITTRGLTTSLLPQTNRCPS
jgi:hypothetical protein